jgi:DNA-binding response OmpR family regulator
MATVLLIDDSATERAAVTERLERAGHRVVAAAEGRTGLRMLYDKRPDIVLLDVVMPDLDGWETLARIRDVSDLPVIMLTARGDELERVRGLRGGADDYVTKPFSALELGARIEAVLRRAEARGGTSESYDDGVVAIDFGRRHVSVAGAQVLLTPLEFRLLATLTSHAGQVLSRDQLLEGVWAGDHGGGLSEVKLYVSYLRKKIGADLIETVRGFGYRYPKPS